MNELFPIFSVWARWRQKGLRKSSSVWLAISLAFACMAVAQVSADGQRESRDMEAYWDSLYSFSPVGTCDSSWGTPPLGISGLVDQFLLGRIIWRRFMVGPSDSGETPRMRGESASVLTTDKTWNTEQKERRAMLAGYGGKRLTALFGSPQGRWWIPACFPRCQMEDMGLSIDVAVPNQVPAHVKAWWSLFRPKAGDKEWREFRAMALNDGEKLEGEYLFMLFGYVPRAYVKRSLVLLMEFRGKTDGAETEYWDCVYELLMYRRREIASGFTISTWIPASPMVTHERSQ